MTWKLHQQKLKGRKILTNYDTVFRDDEVRADILKLMPEDLVNCDIGASEVHLFMEKRRTQKTSQLMISYAISQFRKRKINFHWDSQDIGKVEMRLVDETDIIVHCENLGCGDIDCRNQSCGIDTCGIFRYQPWERRTGIQMGEPFYLNGPRDFYHLFDSEEIVMDFTTEPGEDG